MSDKLPGGWVKTTLGNVCLPVATIQPRDFPDTEFTYFDIGGIDNKNNVITKTKTIRGRSAPSRARQAVQKNDILFSTVRTYLKNIALIERDYPNPVASTGFAVIRAAEGVSPQFLFLQILLEDFLTPLHALQTGSSYPAVCGRDIFAQPVRLAPTREQKRIVAVLQESLASMHASQTAAERGLIRLAKYRDAVVHAAMTGELTRDWRKAHKPNETGAQLLRRLLKARRVRWEESELQRFRDTGRPPKDDNWTFRYRKPIEPETADLPRLPRGWTWASIDQLGWKAGYGTSVKCTPEAKGPAVLRIPNIHNCSLDFSDLKYATSERNLADDDFIAPGDFLLIRTNGSKDLIGRAAVVRTRIKQRCSFASYLIRFRLVGEETLWSWLVLAWDSHFLRSRIEGKAATTAGQYNISLSGLSNIAVPLPPIAEQTELVSEVNRRLAAADRLAATLDRQLERACATRQSLLREAFIGNLVSQNPKDEPSLVLLERIRTALEAEANKPKGKRMPKTKAKLICRPLLDVLREHKKPMTPEVLFRESGHEVLFNESDESQDVVDAFYKELRKLTEKPAKVLEQRVSKHQTMLRSLP